MATFIINESKAEKFLTKKERAREAIEDFFDCAEEMMSDTEPQMGERNDRRWFNVRDRMGQRMHNGYRNSGMYGNRNSVYYPQNNPYSMGERSGWMLQPVPPMYEQGGW